MMGICIVPSFLNTTPRWGYHAPKNLKPSNEIHPLKTGIGKTVSFSRFAYCLPRFIYLHFPQSSSNEMWRIKAPIQACGIALLMALGVLKHQNKTPSVMNNAMTQTCTLFMTLGVLKHQEKNTKCHQQCDDAVLYTVRDTWYF